MLDTPTTFLLTTVAAGMLMLTGREPRSQRTIGWLLIAAGTAGTVSATALPLLAA